jgi:hypothetical protein
VRKKKSYVALTPGRLDGSLAVGKPVLEMWKGFQKSILEIQEAAHFILQFLKIK